MLINFLLSKFVKILPDALLIAGLAALLLHCRCIGLGRPTAVAEQRIQVNVTFVLKQSEQQ